MKKLFLAALLAAGVSTAASAASVKVKITTSVKPPHTRLPYKVVVEYAGGEWSSDVVRGRRTVTLKLPSHPTSICMVAEDGGSKYCPKIRPEAPHHVLAAGAN